MNEKKFKEQLGRRIKKAREDMQVTQVELARKLGMERSSITKIEAGQNQPSAFLLTRIADILEVSAAWLIASSGQEAEFVEAFGDDKKFIKDLITNMYQDRKMRFYILGQYYEFKSRFKDESSEVEGKDKCENGK